MSKKTRGSLLEIENEKKNGIIKTETGSSRRSTKEKLKSGSTENSSACKRVKYNSNSDSDISKSSQPPRKPMEFETDVVILQRRQKQIDYGKNTVGYHNYSLQIDVDERTKDHPKTPDKYAKYSRRSWDALIKMWRKKLHEYDCNKSEEKNDFEDMHSDEDCSN